MNFSRRDFMFGCSAAIAAMASARISGLSFAAPSDGTPRDVLLFIFLRGGCDSLNLVAPTSDPDYIAARPRIRVRGAGETTPGWAMANGPTGIDFRWHPSAAALRDLYDSGALAVVHACGLTNGTRSHFDAQDYIDRGTPTNKTTGTGWITRHLQSIGVEGTIDTTLPAVSASSSVPASILGSTRAVGMSSLSSFDLQSAGGYTDEQRSALRTFYGAGTTPLHTSGKVTLDTIDLLGTPPAPDITFPSGLPGDLTTALRTVAQLIRMDIGLQVATIDFGGWDTHEEQEYPFGVRIDGLGRSLQAFYNYLTAYTNRLTVVVMSEFGRRLKANTVNGTDHGHGGAMLVLGGSVKGGKIYGNWPGLAKEQLDNNVDLAVTTDYRSVLSEILINRLGNPLLGQVFPGMTATDYTPQGIVYSGFSLLQPDFSGGGGIGGGTQIRLPLTMRS